jgi:hypothetical protein
MKAVLSILFTVCMLNTPGQHAPSSSENMDENGNIQILPYKTELPFSAGFRYSRYGIRHLHIQDHQYWISAGQEMEKKFENAAPSSVWILGTLSGEGVYLNFPADTDHALIRTAEQDFNEPIFNEMDEKGFKIWLQVEPGNAPVDELIRIVLDRYAHHTCIIGFGVDVEWFESVDRPEGKAVSDEQAEAWLRLVRSYDPEYRLFLKHWLQEKMPPNYRHGIVFIDDSQNLESMEAMVAEFKAWGEYFSAGQVAFQYGYRSDKVWWSELEDPAKTIGDALLRNIPNTVGLYWVDFTLESLLQPEAYQHP